MTKIKNLTQLRDHLLSTMERLASKEIDVTEAAVTKSVGEGVISTLKAEMEYFRMLGEEPNIDFVKDKSSDNDSYLIEGEQSPKALTYKR